MFAIAILVLGRQVAAIEISEHLNIDDVGYAGSEANLDVSGRSRDLVHKDMAGGVFAILPPITRCPHFQHTSRRHRQRIACQQGTENWVFHGYKNRRIARKVN